MARGILQWNIWNKYQREISKGNINRLLFHCLPLLFMAPHSPFIDRKCHQPFRQLTDRAIEYIPPKERRELNHVEYKGFQPTNHWGSHTINSWDPLGNVPVGPTNKVGQFHNRRCSK